MRNAVSLGGDSDPLACIAGGIAEACYGGVPDSIRAEVAARLTPELWRVVERFERALDQLRKSRDAPQAPQRRPDRRGPGGPRGGAGPGLGGGRRVSPGPTRRGRRDSRPRPN